MVVVYSCDENFADVFATSVVSLFENNQDADDLTVYLIDNGVSKESRLRFQTISDRYKVVGGGR